MPVRSPRFIYFSDIGHSPGEPETSRHRFKLHFGGTGPIFLLTPMPYVASFHLEGLREAPAAAGAPGRASTGLPAWRVAGSGDSRGAWSPEFWWEFPARTSGQRIRDV